MAENIKKKLNNKHGFSLSEMLVTVIILVLATAVVAGGIPAAMKTYKGITAKANAETLLSTTMTLLRDELGTATDISISSDGKSVSYKSSDTKSTVTISSTDNGIYVTEYPGADPHLLVSSAASSGEILSWDSISENTDGVISISSITVKEGDDTLSELSSFSVKTIQRNTNESN